MKRMKNILYWMIVLTALTCILLPGLSPVMAVEKEEEKSGQALPAAEKVKAAFLFNAPVGDGGWIYGHNEGRKKMEELPYVETTYVDNVPESEGWRFINNFARKGNNLVFTCSFGFMHDTKKVAEEYPEVAFEHCSGFMTAPNMGNYFGRNFDPAFLSGMLAGAMTKSEIIGYVAPHPIAEVIRNLNAFALGVKLFNPKAIIKVVWIHTWYDPALEREAAESLISAGADVIGNYQDSPAILQAAQKQGVYAIGQHADMGRFAPKAHLTSVVWNWDVLYKEVAKRLHEGTWKGEPIWWGMKEGLVDIAPIGPMIPKDVQDQVMDYRTRIISGDETALPFYGEVKDQSGKVQIPAGRPATFDELMTMDYLVDNIQGTIPAAK